MALILSCVVVTGLYGPQWTAQSAPARQVKSTGRTVDFTDAWKFLLANRTGADAPQPDANDPGWRDTRLPHDWSIGLDPVQGPNTNAATGFLPGGLGWYRKTFTLPPSMAGKKVSIEFDGVYMDSEVYLNGTLLGRHRYGYTGFAFDLSPRAHTGGTPNVLAVKVRSQVPSSRWYSGSGIYRDVRLVVTEPTRVTRHGVQVTTPDLANTIRSGYATMRVATTAVSEAGAAAEIVSTVRDARGQLVGTGAARAALTAQPSTATADVRIDRPVLWSLDQPHLYTVDTEVRVNGKVVDAVSTRTGVRHFAFDPNNGFSLNGVEMKLKGVNLHHDLGALGAAVSADATVRQLRIMKSMGVNAIRTAHNPPSPEFVRACEEMGILLQVEAFDMWSMAKSRYDYGRFFDANSSVDIREMVHAAKNSPSVVMWSIGNEVYDVDHASGVPIARRLIDDVRAVDTTRPVVMGSHLYRKVPAVGTPHDQILRMLDGLGVNYNNASSIDELHARYPTKFFYEGESSAATATRGSYQDPELLNTGENHTPGKRNTSSYGNNMPRFGYSGEYGLKKDRDRKWFAGQFLWSGIDYLGEPTPYNEVFPVKSSYFGAVDTAGFPKDIYHLFRSQWSSEPMVHLLPMNWTDHKPGERVSVWAYSNADTVELHLNGKSLGERKFDTKTTTYGAKYLETTEATGDDKTVTGGRYPGSYTSPNGSAGKLHLTWSVPFQPGSLVAVAKRGGVEVARDEIRTAGSPDAIRLKADRAVTKADGQSLTFVTADVVDRAGVLVPGADNLISFEVRGGSLAGLDNGRQESAENYQARSRTAFNGKALAIVRSGGSPGGITVTARAPGLRDGTATFMAIGASPGGAQAHPGSAQPDPVPEAGEPAAVAADASYSGAPNTIPAAMVDGNASTYWSNHYLKTATALLPAVSSAHAAEWVSLSGLEGAPISSVRASFLVDAAHALPARISVSYWNGTAFVPVGNPRIEWAQGSGQPTRITFTPVRTSRVRVELTSRSPGSTSGFLGITELTAGRQ